MNNPVYFSQEIPIEIFSKKFPEKNIHYPTSFILRGMMKEGEKGWVENGDSPLDRW